MESAKPAGATSGHREFVIADWKPHLKNTLRGFLSVRLPSGMVLHNLTVHEKGDARWVSLPSREWIDLQGARQFAPLIEFADRATANRFRDAVLAAFDRHLASGARS